MAVTAAYRVTHWWSNHSITTIPCRCTSTAWPVLLVQRGNRLARRMCCKPLIHGVIQRFNQRRRRHAMKLILLTIVSPAKALLCSLWSHLGDYPSRTTHLNSRLLMTQATDWTGTGHFWTLRNYVKDSDSLIHYMYYMETKVPSIGSVSW